MNSIQKQFLLILTNLLDIGAKGCKSEEHLTNFRETCIKILDEVVNKRREEFNTQDTQGEKSNE